MKNKAILVTGGAGYIGSHAVKELKKVGLRPIVYDNLSSGHKEAVLGCDLIIGDLANKSLLGKTFKKYKPFAVMHFAAFINAAESVKNPLKYYQNNIVNGLNLLEVMAKTNTKKIVFSSSAAVYGEAKKMPITENSPTAPINPYGWTKLMFEKILADFEKAYGIKFVSLRYFNVAGADPEGKVPVFLKNKEDVISILIKVASGQQKRFTIFGTDYKTRDGSCLRDFVHVTDLAIAHIKALSYLEKNNKSDILNLGSEKGFTVKEIVKATKKITGIDFKVIEGERRKGDIIVSIASSQKAKKNFGWQPKYGNLDTIIRSFWKQQKF